MPCKSVVVIRFVFGGDIKAASSASAQQSPFGTGNKIMLNSYGKRNNIPDVSQSKSKKGVVFGFGPGLGGSRVLCNWRMLRIV